MNPANVNIVMLAAAATMVAAAAFGASGSGSKIKHEASEILEVEDGFSQDQWITLERKKKFWNGLAQDEIPDDEPWAAFGEFWNRFKTLRENHSSELGALPASKEEFIKGVAEDGRTEAWRAALESFRSKLASNAVNPADQLKPYLAANDQKGTLVYFAKTASSELDQLRNQLSLPLFELEKKDLRLAGKEFAWINTAGFAFWISKDEIEIGGFDGLEDGIRTKELSGGSYEIRKPSKDEWVVARNQLNGGFQFDGGLGEQLLGDPPTIIGSATGFKKSNELIETALEERERIETTKFTPEGKKRPPTGPAGLGLPGIGQEGKKDAPTANRPATPEIKETKELNFATRIVIVPKS